MKKGLIAIFVALVVLISCTDTVTSESSNANTWVVNSEWKIVKEFAVSRDLTSTDAIEAEVAEYNAANTDDQYTIITDAADLAITDAPDATLTLVYADNYEIYAQETLDRDLLGTRKVDYYQDLVQLNSNGGRGGVLYVDNPSPAYVPPVVVVPKSDYEKYAIYIIDADGMILYEEHCADTERADEDQVTDAEYYAQRSVNIWEHYKYEFPTAVQCILGELYTEPVEETPVESE